MANVIEEVTGAWVELTGIVAPALVQNQSAANILIVEQLAQPTEDLGTVLYSQNSRKESSITFTELSTKVWVKAIGGTTGRVVY